MSDHYSEGPNDADPESVDPVPREWTDRLDVALETWSQGAAARVSLPTRRRSPFWAWAAMAASVAGLLALTQVPWGSRGSDPAAPRPEGPIAPMEGVALRAGELDISASGVFMLVPSGNPSITIVWLLDSPENPGESS